MNGDVSALDRRLLFLALTNKDAATTEGLFNRAGLPVITCRTFEALVEELRAGCAAILIPEEAVSRPAATVLSELLAAQPQWSDLPILILTRQGADSASLGEAVRLLGNVTLLERPVRFSTLVSAVQTAVRARERQYQIREHLAERARAEESLRVADQRKDEFLATLGHELRNPLAPLLAALHLLKTAHLHDPTTVHISTMMERQINHLVRLVNDLLEVSRITRGLIEVQREPLDLELVLQSAIETSRPVIEAGGHELTVERPDEAMTLFGDGVRLTQVFANLLTNAAKYTNAGGHIAVSVKKVQGLASISVRDDGIGIAPDRLDSVFDMFTQVDRSSRRAQGGLGIGLTLVRSLVAMHGGRVEARSDGLGRGSEFIVQLPIVAGRASARRDQAAPSAFPSRRVLIVDDNDDAADTLGELLRTLGAHVCVVHSGRDALDVFDAFAPDSVLLDIGMPQMDGYEVARRIRAKSHERPVLLIALTGWGQEHDQQRSRAAGFDHHVVKPPDIDRLRTLLSAGWQSELTINN